MTNQENTLLTIATCVKMFAKALVIIACLGLGCWMLKTGYKDYAEYLLYFAIAVLILF
jgi:hypothetical protein